MKSIKGISDYLIAELKKQGFRIQRYASYSTSSIYLKLDYGMGNSIRISDHKGKKHLSYKYNVLLGIHQSYVDTRGKHERRYYTCKNVQQLIEDILAAREEKIEKYGLGGYKYFMTKNLAENSDSKGFWEQAIEV